ncbi:hypothetical protein HPP92_010266 [Vanilla planifolia]|uniref:Uncharacterized protein n=1 Tax=Vanilla planifolia TaxID=51239 RepID=A0A835UZJ7_VANPL|nr:hypothetical protein HPP92_010266 [Vanilla planifolia]
MTDVIRSEISLLEAEEQSRFVEMEAIRSELIRSGAIHKLWEEKQCETRNLTLQADRDLERALFDLEVERAAEDERLAGYLKEKAALECQQELLLCLTKEVDEMRRKLVNETAIFKVEKQKLESDVQDLVENEAPSLKPDRFWNLRKQLFIYYGPGWRKNLGVSKAEPKSLSKQF